MIATLNRLLTETGQSG